MSILLHNTPIFQYLFHNRPTGFRNAANQLRMHPSDTRMSSWSPGTYTVGTSALTDFPMALFKSVNSPLTIKFTATSSQTGAATLRIGTTLSFAGGRPQVTVRGNRECTEVPFC